MNVNPENIAQHLISFGYSAKAGTVKDKVTGQATPAVFVNGLGSINAYLNLSDDPKKFGLKVFGNLQPGYSPIRLDENGDVLRETVDESGETVTRAMRGDPLDPTALKRKNNEISLSARREITGAVLAAYMLEVGGGDLELVRDGFRLQKWDRNAPRLGAGNDGADETAVESAQSFALAAAPEVKAESKRFKRSQGPKLG
jgi:hypothetical protein